jgi:hypothetical protein
MSENSINENEYVGNAEDKSASETPTATGTETTTTEQPADTAEDAKSEEAASATATAATAVVKIEGQEFPLDVAIAEKDELLKAALSPHYPSIKNAQISRETRAGQMIVSIVKRAEHKGSGEQSAT